MKNLLDYSITMSNDLARASQGLSLVEKRIISLALSKINSRNADVEIARQQGLTVEISAASFADTFRVSPDTAYGYCKAAVNGLGNALADTGKEQFNWASGIDYRNGLLTLTFSPGVAAHLIGLKRTFISYRLKAVAELSSIYSWRLFECLTSWRLKNGWTAKIVDFYRALDAEESYKKDYAALRRRIIQPAVDELQALYNQSLTYEPVREGRKLTGIEFRYSKPSDTSKPQNDSEPKILVIGGSKASDSSVFDDEGQDVLTQLQQDRLADLEAEEEYRQKFPEEFFDKNDWR